MGDLTDFLKNNSDHTSKLFFIEFKFTGCNFTVHFKALKLSIQNCRARISRILSSKENLQNTSELCILHLPLNVYISSSWFSMIKSTQHTFQNIYSQDSPAVHYELAA